MGFFAIEWDDDRDEISSRIGPIGWFDQPIIDDQNNFWTKDIKIIFWHFRHVIFRGIDWKSFFLTFSLRDERWFSFLISFMAGGTFFFPWKKNIKKIIIQITLLSKHINHRPSPRNSFWNIFNNLQHQLRWYINFSARLVVAFHTESV